jgi:hypothetical protein
MKPISLLFFAFAASVAFMFSSCDKHNNDVTITIVSPTDGQTVANDSSVVVNVLVTASEEVEDVHIELHAHGSTDLILDSDVEHVHESSYSFTQTVDLSSYASGTEFHLMVSSSIDHDGDEKVTKEITFTIP